MKYISATELAKIAGISRQAVQQAMLKAYNGKEWRGFKLKVHLVKGRGGKSGRQYVVQIDSLPNELKERLKASQAPNIAHSKASKDQIQDNKQEDWWLRTLSPLLQNNITKHDRSLLVNNICSRDLTDWNGNPKKISRSTIYSRLKKLKVEGIGSQSRKGRSDRGNRRVYISKIWDTNVPFDDEIKQLVSNAVTKQIQGYVKTGLPISKTELFINEYLVEQTLAQGFRPNKPSLLKQICKVPKYKIQEQKRFKNVHRFKTDKKEHYDASPSIVRDWSQLEPMECVVADVHHLNFLIDRENGTQATAKMIAFQDMATNRIWSGLVFFEQKAGVRNTDVINVFAGMLSDPSWGVPKTLYVDNGAEYLFADYLSDLLQLVYPTTSLSSGEKSKYIIRAIPYNGKAKPIEARFGHLEQHYFKHLDGYIGDDRMNPKTDRLGKLPTALRSFEIAERDFTNMMKAYHHFPQKGFLNGSSPSDRFNDFVNAGWSATIVKTDDINAAISKPQNKKVYSDFIKIKNIQFQADELAMYSGERVIVYIPSYTDFISVRIETDKSEFICNAYAEKAYRYDDREGAKRSSERKLNYDKKLREMDKQTPNPNVKEEFEKLIDRSNPAQPNEPNAVVSIFGDELAPPSPKTNNVIPIQKNIPNNQTEIEENRKFIPEYEWRK